MVGFGIPRPGEWFMGEDGPTLCEEGLQIVAHVPILSLTDTKEQVEQAMRNSPLYPLVRDDKTKLLTIKLREVIRPRLSEIT